jgi:DnaJ homolog subfamily C member 17
MDSSEILAFAREYSSKNIDLYELLGIDSLKAADANEVKRAYRKQSIKYHPDKLGDDFDPDKWQLLERGRDVLMDKAAKDAYDAARSAALREQERRSAMNAKRKAAIEDLEARERGEVPKRLRKEDDTGMSAAERQQLNQEGNRRLEMRRRQMAEAEERERKAQELVNLAQTKQKEPVDTSEIPVPTSQPAPNPEDEDDPEIAAIQQRIREAQEKKAAKAARKAEKAARKAGDNASAPPDTSAQAQEKSTSIPPATESQADEKKKVPKFSFTSPSTTSAATAPKNDWASMKERLKAAQAERERRKAETA